MTEPCDVIIIGAGIAGLTCAGELVAAGLSVTQFEPGFPGGLVINVNELSDFEPANGLSGMDYAATLAVRNRKAGVRSVPDAVTAMQVNGNVFDVTAGDATFTARFVVVASGAHLQKLQIPGAAEFEGLGVSECADCDAPLYTGASVAIAGDGPWAVQDALLLARECATVHLVCASERLQAPDAAQRPIEAAPNVELHTHTTVAAVLGNDQGVTGVRLQDTRATTTALQDLPVAALFVMTGLVPNSEIAPPTVARDDTGALHTNEHRETALPGLWAIGQVRAGFGGGLTQALEDARHAALGIQARARS
ncbi:MAG TPA: NAD(P)/FAD-dependent oxidoreductase [Castellaniella sp.]|uniref:NAD(P)/FAD-dependent oxidoreductase n=1 Tax=Castellaniella sp. TaxID=1955812 RepID=UPI002EDE6420